MNILLKNDYYTSSNPAALFSYLMNKKVNLVYRSRDFSYGKTESSYDIAITDNRRCIDGIVAKLGVNLGHGNFFLGDTGPEPSINISIANSDSERQMMIFNGYSPQDVFSCGRPRLDILYNEVNSDYIPGKWWSYLADKGLDPKKGPAVLYAPTYDRRNHGAGTKLFFANSLTEEDDIRMAEALVDGCKNRNLIIRVHGYYKKLWKDGLPDYLKSIFDRSNIYFCTHHDDPDSIGAIISSTTLITDFSSIIGDCLPIDMNFIFIEPNPKWRYTNKWHAPKDIRYKMGKVVDNPVQLLFCLENNHWHRDYNINKREVREIYSPYFDGHCCERTWNTIKMVYEKKYGQTILD